MEETLERVHRKCQEAIFCLVLSLLPSTQWKTSLDSTKLPGEQRTNTTRGRAKASFLSRGLDAVLLRGDLGRPGAEPSRKQVVHFRQGCRVASQAIVPTPRDSAVLYRSCVLSCSGHSPYRRGKTARNAKLPGGGGGSAVGGRERW